MWTLSLPWWEFIARGAIVYLFLLAILRLTGKRQLGQMSPFDLVLLLVLSNALQNAMNGGDNSVAGGLISAITLIAMNSGVAALTYRSKKLEAIIEGRPQVLVHNGTVHRDVLKSVSLTEHELMAALRREGCMTLEEVHLAILENTGQMTVVPRKANQGTDG